MISVHTACIALIISMSFGFLLGWCCRSWIVVGW